VNEPVSAARREAPFYVGWQPRADAAVERFVAPVALALVLTAPLAAALLCLAQERFDEARFEYGTLRTFQGEIAELPYPTLRLLVPGTPDALAWPLVAPGKHGASELVAGLAGRRVEACGTLIARDGQVMLELASEAPLRELAAGAALADAAVEDLGRRVLIGEIVDTKCYYGVMKPGHSKPHRACAIRCISGGVPPTLLVRHAELAGSPATSATYYLLTGTRGEPLNAALVDLDLIALPVEIEGQVTRRDGALHLAADPAAIRRLE
jgi:hypothetical protein